MSASKPLRGMRLGLDPIRAGLAHTESVAGSGAPKPTLVDRVSALRTERIGGNDMARERAGIRNVPRTLNRLLGLLEDGLSSALLLAIVIVMFVAVSRRYVLHSPVAYMNELVVLLSVWFASLGAASASRRGMHIRIDLLVDVLPGRLRFVVRLLTNAFLVVVLVVLTKLGVTLATNSFQQFDSLGISKGYMVAALPVAFGLMALQYLLAVYNDIVQIIGRGGDHD